MTQEELKSFIQSGEGYNVEYKQSLPSKLSEIATELCAFANANGGILLVGVDDRQAVIGIDLDNRKRSHIQTIVNLIDPPIPITTTEHQLNGKTVLCFHCPTGEQKPYAVSGSIYVRNGPNSEKITSTEKIRTFFQRSDSIMFDSAACSGFRYPYDFDKEAFDLFVQRAGITPSIGEAGILENLRLHTIQGNLTNAGVLFFAKDVQAHIPYAFVRCVLFKGTDKRYIIDSKEITGNLLTQYEETLKYIISKLNLRYEIESQRGGPRQEILEIPETAFREALVNALCHRSYYEQGANVMVEIYDDRVEISNPGGLVSTITDKEFGKRSFSRNPLIFGLMQRVNLVEKVGSGIRRIQDSMIEAGLPEPRFDYGGFFTVTFLRPVDFESWLSKWQSYLSAPMVKILLAIQENDEVTKAMLSDIIGQGKTSVDNHISKLRGLGILTREGSDRKGRWLINHIPAPDSP